MLTSYNDQMFDQNIDQIGLGGIPSKGLHMSNTYKSKLRLLGWNPKGTAPGLMTFPFHDTINKKSTKGFETPFDARSDSIKVKCGDNGKKKLLKLTLPRYNQNIMNASRLKW